MKKCPYCAEEIQDDAIKCRFCGEFLNPALACKSGVKKKKGWLNCLFGCLLSVILFIALIFLFFYSSFLLLKFMIYKAFFAAPQGQSHFYYGPGAGNIFLDFNEFFRNFWYNLMDLLRNGLSRYSV